MITEKDLHEAIAECQGERNPNANTCIKLAAYYTILNKMEGKREYPMTGYSADPEPETIRIDSDSEFARIVNGKEPRDLWGLIDELVSTVSVVNPRLYASFIRRLEE